MWEISTFLYKISTCVWKAYYLLATGLRALKWRRRTGTGSRTGRRQITGRRRTGTRRGRGGQGRQGHGGG